MKKSINKKPKNMPMLISGVALYVLSPVLGFFVPQFFERFTCTSTNGFDFFSCLIPDFWFGLGIGAVVFVMGTVLIFLSLRLHRK